MIQPGIFKACLILVAVSVCRLIVLGDHGFQTLPFTCIALGSCKACQAESFEPSQAEPSPSRAEAQAHVTL